MDGLDQRVGWLSLDEGDNDLSRFVTYLVAALQNAGLGVDAVDVGEPVSTTLTALVNDIVRAAAPESATHWILVLDDYHLLHNEVVHSSVAYLLRASLIESVRKRQAETV